MRLSQQRKFCDLKKTKEKHRFFCKDDEKFCCLSENQMRIYKFLGKGDNSKYN
jgi:hypothetical protein